MRFLVFFGVFAIIMFYIPTLEGFASFREYLGRYGLNQRLIAVSVSAVLGIGLIALTLSRQSRLVFRLAFMFGIGLFLSGGWGLAEYLAGVYPKLVFILLMPTGLALGELVASAFFRYNAPTKDSASEHTPSYQFLRLVAFGVSYGVIVFMLPEQDDVRRLLKPLIVWDPSMVFWLYVASIPVALVIGYVAVMSLVKAEDLEGDDPPEYRFWGRQILLFASKGLLLAGLVGVFVRLIGHYQDIQPLIFVPLGFAVGEGVFLMIVYRMERGPLET